jgi:hypothetical protein
MGYSNQVAQSKIKLKETLDRLALHRSKDRPGTSFVKAQRVDWTNAEWRHLACTG